MFEAIQRATFQGLTLCITQLPRDFILPFVHELLGYIASNFDDKPLAVVECLRVLFVATFSLEGHPGSVKNHSATNASPANPQQPPQPSRPATPQRPPSINPMPTPEKKSEESVYSQLMLDPQKHPLFSPLSSRTPSGEANNWQATTGTWSKGGWDVAIKDVTSRQTPLQMNVVLKYVSV